MCFGTKHSAAANQPLVPAVGRKAPGTCRIREICI
jgi:hypothetical protein